MLAAARVAELDRDVVERQAEQIGGHLRHDRVSAGTYVGESGRDLCVSIGRQHDADGGLHLQRFPDASGHAPADQFAAVAH